MKGITRLALAIGLTLAVGCGSGLEGPPGERGEFEPYFQRFEAESLRHGRNTRGDGMMSIVFGQLEHWESGRCEWNFFSGRLIVVAKEKWDLLTEFGREALIFHELGHCLLRREHVDTIVRASNMTARDDDEFEGAAQSIMNKNCVPGGQYKKWREYYVRELFQPGSALPARAGMEPPTETPTPTPTPTP